jgi:hypothetical protein
MARGLGLLIASARAICRDKTAPKVARPWCCHGWISGLDTVVAKDNVDFTDSVRFNGQEPVSRRGKATRSGEFKMQSAEAISAAYYFDLAARDYTLADSAIELVIEGVPCSAFIESSQSRELIFYARSDLAARAKNQVRMRIAPKRELKCGGSHQYRFQL